MSHLLELYTDIMPIRKYISFCDIYISFDRNLSERKEVPETITAEWGRNEDSYIFGTIKEKTTNDITQSKTCLVFVCKREQLRRYIILKKDST